jgi:muconate/chloromuconate cycloisomerase
MKITAIEAIPVAIPLNHPLKMAVATVSRRDSIIVRIHTDEGLIGLGEAVIAPYFSGETQAGAKVAIDGFLAPVLLGSDVKNMQANLAKLDRVLYGNPSAKSCIDIALYDLFAQSLNVPLYQLLGGKLKERVNSTWAISSEEPENAAEEAMEGVQQGFKAIKIKVGVASLEKDIQRIYTVRDRIGNNVHLRADANQAWSPKIAIQFLKAVEECHLQFIEQPVSRTDVNGMAQVARDVNTPVAPDEGVFNAEDALRYIRQAAADGIVMKIMKAGGISGCLSLAAVTRAANLGLHLGGMPGQTSISAAAEIHLAISLPGLTWDTGIYPHTISQDVVTERLKPVDGSYLPSEKPGLGVELDEDALTQCRVDL